MIYPLQDRQMVPENLDGRGVQDNQELIVYCGSSESSVA